MNTHGKGLFDYAFFSCDHLLCKKRERVLFFGVFRESSYQFKATSSVEMERSLLEKGEIWSLLIAEIEFPRASGCAPLTPAAVCSLE